MNVSPEADAAFMRDLKRNDPTRYRNLINNMQKSHFAAQKNVKSLVCGNERDGVHMLPDDARKDAKYCSHSCQLVAYRVRRSQKTA